ncbi:hypothetical protein [Methylocystis hirsuta]|uniref:hypothetical protein n=1 Tax=Methylocystis hirsuta TaxID=369798 RepID=UPI0014730ECA|nr:hypothetical protein [Methylocystis hirsuta]
MSKTKKAATANLCVRVSITLRKELESLAATQERRVTDVVRSALLQYVQNTPHKKNAA